MTRKETAQLLFMLKEYYPASFENSSIENRVNAWHMILQDKEFALIQAAMVAFVSSDKKGFMPSVGQLIDKAIALQNQDEMTELEAWGIVSKALRNSAYNAAEEYAKMPPVIQRAVGDPVQLKTWAMMEEDEVQTVIASNFQRSFRTAQVRQRDFETLPDNIKKLISDGSFLKSLPEGEQWS